MRPEIQQSLIQISAKENLTILMYSSSSWFLSHFLGSNDRFAERPSSLYALSFLLPYIYFNFWELTFQVWYGMHQYCWCALVLQLQYNILSNLCQLN